MIDLSKLPVQRGVKREDIRLTVREEQFLKYYQSVLENKVPWTYNSAALALKYRSVGSIMSLITNLRNKGFVIETERSKVLKWKRGEDSESAKE